MKVINKELFDKMSYDISNGFGRVEVEECYGEENVKLYLEYGERDDLFEGEWEWEGLKKEMCYNNSMKEVNKESMKKDWLKVVDGSRGEIEEVSWIKDKSFDEIVKIGEKMLKENVDGILSDVENEEDVKNVKLYVDEFCGMSSKEGKGVEMSLNEESGVGFYDEEIVSKLKGVDLDDEEKYLEVRGVIDEVVGSCWK
jgi:hypothetical protein